jgi:hypothetical protein
MKDKHFNYEEFAIADKRKAYEEKFDVRFKTWTAKVALLTVKTGKAEVEAKIPDNY